MSSAACSSPSPPPPSYCRWPPPARAPAKPPPDVRPRPPRSRGSGSRSARSSPRGRHHRPRAGCISPSPLEQCTMPRSVLRQGGNRPGSGGHGRARRAEGVLRHDVAAALDADLATALAGVPDGRPRRRAPDRREGGRPLDRERARTTGATTPPRVYEPDERPALAAPRGREHGRGLARLRRSARVHPPRKLERTRPAGERCVRRRLPGGAGWAPGTARPPSSRPTSRGSSPSTRTSCTGTPCATC